MEKHSSYLKAYRHMAEVERNKLTRTTLSQSSCPSITMHFTCGKDQCSLYQLCIVDCIQVYFYLKDVRCHSMINLTMYLKHGGPCPGGLVKLAPMDANASALL